MSKWFGRPSEVLEAVRNLTDEQAAEALKDLHTVLEDTSLTKGQQAVKVNEIEKRVLREGGKIK